MLGFSIQSSKSSEVNSRGGCWVFEGGGSSMTSQGEVEGQIWGRGVADVDRLYYTGGGDI